MESQFRNYFNKILKEYVKYPETFSFFQNKDLIRLTPDQPSHLILALKTDTSFKNNLFEAIKQVLNKAYKNNVQSVDLNIKDEYIEVLFKLKSYEIYGLPTELYAIILSYASSGDVDKFCKLGSFSAVAEKDIICNESFYFRLVYESFSEYVKSVKLRYSWREVYDGLSVYRSKMIDYFIKLNKQKRLAERKGRSVGLGTMELPLDKDFYLDLLNNHKEAFKYLLETKNIDLNEFRFNLYPNHLDKFIETILLYDDTDLFDLFISSSSIPIYYSLKPMELYYGVLSKFIVEENIFDYLTQIRFVNKSNIMKDLKLYLNKITGTEGIVVIQIHYNKIQIYPGNSNLLGLIKSDISINSYILNYLQKEFNKINNEYKDFNIQVNDIITINYVNNDLSKHILSNYVKDTTPEYTFERGVDNDNKHFTKFNEYSSFLKFQQDVVDGLSTTDLTFYLGLMNRIKDKDVFNMDEESMVIFDVDSFFFIKVKGEIKVVIWNGR